MSGQLPPTTLKRKRDASAETQQSQTQASNQSVFRGFNELAKRDQIMKGNRKARVELNWGVKMQDSVPLRFCPRVELKKGAKVRIGDQDQKEERWWNWSVELLRALEELSEMTSGKFPLAQALLTQEVQKRHADSKHPQRKVAELLVGDVQRAVESMRQVQKTNANPDHVDQAAESVDDAKQLDKPSQTENDEEDANSQSDSLFVDQEEVILGANSTQAHVTSEPTQYNSRPTLSTMSAAPYGASTRVPNVGFQQQHHNSTDSRMSSATRQSPATSTRRIHAAKNPAQFRSNVPVSPISISPHASDSRVSNTSSQQQSRNGPQNFSATRQSPVHTAYMASNQEHLQASAHMQTSNLAHSPAQVVVNTQHFDANNRIQLTELRARSMRLRAQALQLEADAAQLEEQAALMRVQLNRR